jgi:acyl transferase domain-containing protein
MLHFDAAYWRMQARQPVRFVDALQTMDAQGCKLFLEVGPQSVLSSLGKETLDQQSIFIPSLRRGSDDARTMAEATAKLYESGASVDWTAYQPKNWQRIAGCAYPFRRDRIWPPEPTPGTASVSRSGSAHALLGYQLESPLPQQVFEGLLSTAELPFLDDHQVFGKVVVPGTMHGVMAIAAAEQLALDTRTVEDLVFEQALEVPAEGLKLQMIVDPTATGATRFAIHTQQSDSTWVRHATGSLTNNQGIRPASVDLNILQQRLTLDQDGPEPLFHMLDEMGIVLGPSFQGLQTLWRGDGEALAQIELPVGLEEQARQLPIHPAVLDSCFQMLGATFSGDGTNVGFLPLSVNRLNFWQKPPARFWCHVTTGETSNSNEVVVGNFQLMDDTGSTLISIEGLQIKRVSPPQPQDMLADAFLALDWIPSDLPAAHWANPAILADQVRRARTSLLKDLPEDLTVAWWILIPGVKPLRWICSGSYWPMIAKPNQPGARVTG